MRVRRLPLLLFAIAAAGLFGPSRTSFTQSPRQSRIKGRIAGSPMVWLQGNRRPMFQAENDLGPAPDSLKLENITLAFKLTADQENNLAALLDQQQDRNSPLYRQWLTPEQFADNFGLSADDVAQVAAWLQSQGFTVTRKARSRLWIGFSGTAGQVRSAFQTEIHNYSFRGQTYYGPASEPAVPAVLSEVVLGFTALDDFGPKPHSVFRQVAAPSPEFTSSISGNTFVTPSDFATVYDIQSLYNAGITGSGQSIAVMGETDIELGDIAAFRAASGLPANIPTVVFSGADPGTSTNTGIINEAALDIEWSGAVAPNAKIFYVNSKDAVFGSLKYAIDNKTAAVLSISYGECEANWGASNLNALAQLAQQANTQGQTIIAAAGDSGAADCDYSTNPNSPVTIATHGYAVDAPASLPYVTGMGGSEFNEGSGAYWQPTTSTGDILASALSYIPEMVWNDTSAPENTAHQLLAGGGGASTYTPPGAPSKPVWQAGLGVPNDNARDVPDLSLNASSAHDSYLICVQGSCVNGYRNSDQTLSVAGGTSAASPAFAGIVALIDQRTSMSQGNVNPTLYSMAQTSPAAFHDITVGNNVVPCRSGTSNCGSGGQIGFSAGPGYDEASGLGSIDVYNLVMAWGLPGTGNLPAPILTTPFNGATGASPLPPFTWSQVTGNNGYIIMIAPSPALLTSDPSTSTCAASCTVTSTVANSNSYTPTSALTPGTYYWQVQAIPSSSGGYGAWSNIFSFTTTGGSLPAPTLTAPGAGSSTVALPATFSWTSVAGSAGYRIVVATLRSALPTNPAVATCGGACSIDTTTAATTLAPAPPFATALNGATSYFWEVQTLAPSGGGQNGPWSAVSSFTTAAADFTLSAAPSSLTIAPGSAGTSTVTLTAINNFSATPTFTCSVAGTLGGVTCAVGSYSNNAVTVTITASSTARTFPTLPQAPHFGNWQLAGIAMLFCGLLIGVLRRSARAAGDAQTHLVALVVILAVLMLAGFGCGGGSGGGGGSTITAPPESGNVTMTGTSGSTSHTVTIAVNVS